MAKNPFTEGGPNVRRRGGRVRETCHTRAPRGGSPGAHPPSDRPVPTRDGRPLLLWAPHAAPSPHAVGQKSNRADFKIQSIKRLPERKKEREKMNHKEAERRRLTDLIFRHE